MPKVEYENADARHHEGKKEMLGVHTQADSSIEKCAARLFDRSWAVTFFRLFKKARTKVALIVMAWCLGEGVYARESPFVLARPNVGVVIGLLLIASGLALRLGALGCIRKKERLATRGVYSLCRHPLYLGSVLLAYGFCTLLADVENFVLATAYFIVFYPLTIMWEEMRLGMRYGEDHSHYRAETPIWLPLGSFRTGEFTWQAAMSKGGGILVGIVAMLLVGVHVMAQAMLP